MCENLPNPCAEDMGQFLYHLHSDTGRTQIITIKIINTVPSFLIKHALIITCRLNIQSSIYIYIYIYTFICP